MDSDKPCSDLELSDGCVDNTSLEVNNSGVVFTHESLAAEAMTQSGCETRPEKRSREMDPNEVWTIVGRRGKRQARVDSNDSELIIPQEKIEVSIISKEKLPKQISLARLLKAEGITDVMRVKYISAYKVLIQLKDDKSADKLLACQALIEKGFRCQKTMDVDKSYGIIRDIDLDLSDDEVLQNISCDIPILGVRRQKRRNFETNEFELTEVVQQGVSPRERVDEVSCTYLVAGGSSGDQEKAAGFQTLAWRHVLDRSEIRAIQSTAALNTHTDILRLAVHHE
ncbi:unnamed protein product [Plutella xylostella]|uniref:(diamondback moth) hypothetical protein n=1 Tax=Plutella xylostella TaxID=51655 RepID=A0A8S4GCZ5_PLUXY|nr:unnamed protein product [Plutella xylostella]